MSKVLTSRKHSKLDTSQIDHNHLLTILQDEHAILEELEKHLESEIEKSPEGTVNICQKKNRGTCEVYLYNPGGSPTYLHRAKDKRISKLIQKSYDIQLLKAVKRRLRKTTALEKVCLQPLSSLFSNQHPYRQSLLTPYFLPNDLYIEKWYDEHPGNLNSIEPSKAILTDRGEIVRSKSEKMLADFFYHSGIPYVYEPELCLNDGTYIYPDFLILNPLTRKEYYFEHFGMMDNIDYAENAITKIWRYAKNGIFVGVNLLISQETREQPLQISIVKKMLISLGFEFR